VSNDEKKLRALIVEDDSTIAELERDYLEAAGFSSEIESDGAQALATAQALGPDSPFDLYLVDLMLPGSDGFAICKELRKRTEVPILVVSARESDRDKVRALGLGIDDYVTKPFSPAELVARAKAHVERYARLRNGREDPAGQAKLIVARDLVIDLGRKSVEVGGKSAQLTATEFAILALLAAAPGRVFSRDEIFESIRGEGTYGEVSTVTVHIRRLREKIEQDPSSPARIETVWGMGYKLVE
jgi:two-component system, OmpR family, alkaline phosphatase synthesis response regulator PhoP